MKMKHAVAADAASTGERTKGPVRLNLPGFIRDDIGLGDALSYVTRSLGVPTCSACSRRAQTLNGWVSFRGRRS